MLIFPAIDIIEGKVVRLTRGDYGTVKNYEISPLQAAENFKACGASCMHIVDLDGAKSGNADNASAIEKIAAKKDIFIEVGGGIRSEEQIKKYLDGGVGRIILGTIAVKNFGFVERMAAKYGNFISVGVDACGGRVAVSGWKEITEIDSFDFCRRLQAIGVNHVIYTDIARDGTLSGTNMEIYELLSRTLSMKITASGGITYIEEIEKLRNLNAYGAILGKALYEERLDLRRAVAVGERQYVGKKNHSLS